MILSGRQLIALVIILCLAPLLALASGNSCAAEAKAVTDSRFKGAYEKSRLVIQTHERENIQDIARKIAKRKIVTEEDLETLRAAIDSWKDSKKNLEKHTQRIRADYYAQMYQRCSGRPSGMDSGLNVSFHPDTSNLPPPVSPSKKRKVAGASTAPMKLRLKRISSNK